MTCSPCGGEGFADAIRPIFPLEVDEVPSSGGIPVKVPREPEFGVRNPRKLLDPKLPTKKEVEDHNLTHMPYRNWCPYCVAGKGKSAPHFKHVRADGLPELHLDYCFMSTEGKPLATILVAKEKSTKMVMATMVPMKGGSIEFPARRVLTFLREIGLESSDIVLKSDQENAITDLLNNIANRRSASSKLEGAEGEMAAPQSRGGPASAGEAGRNIREASPVGSSGSNGFIERGIQDIEGQARTIKLALEAHIGGSIPSDHNLIPWIVEYASVLLNRGQVGSDGKTAYERLKAKASSIPGLEFGERILWRSNVPAKDRRHKLDAAWKKGVFL